MLCTDEEFKSLEQTFEITCVLNGKACNYSLIEDGPKVLVDSYNLKMFIEKYSDFLVNELIHHQFESIERGFYSIIRKPVVSYLQSKELEKIIVGCNSIDIDALREHSVYSGFEDDSSVLMHFWEIFKEYSSEDRRRLLQFITGNDRIPVAGPESFRLVIMKNGCDTDRLPSSQTCFNTLLLPEYSSKEKLREKLFTAITMTKGFFLL
jgi:ubiquitin-protein ligase E3 A